MEELAEEEAEFEAEEIAIEEAEEAAQKEGQDEDTIREITVVEKVSLDGVAATDASKVSSNIKEYEVISKSLMPD